MCSFIYNTEAHQNPLASEGFNVATLYLEVKR